LNNNPALARFSKGVKKIKDGTQSGIKALLSFLGPEIVKPETENLFERMEIDVQTMSVCQLSLRP